MTRDRSNEIGEQISTIREFNRFYTARLGLLRRRHLDGEFSLTEARILYEIGSSPQMTASTLCSTLSLDPGYISRLLASVAKKRLVRRTTSKTDNREKPLTLTSSGERALDRLNALSAEQLNNILAEMNADDRETLVASLKKAHQILSRKPGIRIERLTIVSDAALAILEEYYEAVHVVVRDKPGNLKRLIIEAGSGMWLAYCDEEVVGCVVLRRLQSMPRAAECKRLYVKPSARGKGIAQRLLVVQEEFAHAQGMEWIYLDSYDDLKAAIALYEQRGYKHCKRYNENPQATLFMRKRITTGSQSR